MRDTSSYSDRIGDNKTPGLNYSPNKALKLTMKSKTNMFANTFEANLKEIISSLTEKLLLLPKPYKSFGGAASYHPICLLNAMERIMKKVVRNGLLSIIENRIDHHYRFRQTTDTICTILSLAGASGILAGSVPCWHWMSKPKFNSAN